MTPIVAKGKFLQALSYRTTKADVRIPKSTLLLLLDTIGRPLDPIDERDLWFEATRSIYLNDICDGLGS